MASLSDQIKEKLREFWKECQLEDALDAEDELFSATGVMVDSLTACDVLLTLESLVDTKLEADKIIRAGGYDDEEQFVTHITEKVLAAIGQPTGAP
jgi:acyl carrier protein